MFTPSMWERFKHSVKNISILTFHGGDLDVLPVQTNSLLLISDDQDDGDDKLSMMILVILINDDISDTDEDHQNLPWGEFTWCEHCVIMKSNTLLRQL